MKCLTGHFDLEWYLSMNTDRRTINKILLICNLDQEQKTNYKMHCHMFLILNKCLKGSTLNRSFALNYRFISSRIILLMVLNMRHAQY